MQNAGFNSLSPWNINPIYVIHIYGTVFCFLCDTHIFRKSQICALSITTLPSVWQVRRFVILAYAMNSLKCVVRNSWLGGLWTTCILFMTLGRWCLPLAEKPYFSKICSVTGTTLVKYLYHYDDVIMMAIASQITSLTIVFSAVYSGAHQRKHQSSASLAFVQGIHRGPVNSPHKWPVTRRMFPFDDVIMTLKNPISNTPWPCDPDKNPKNPAPEVYLSICLIVKQCQVRNKKAVPQPRATTNDESWVSASVCITAITVLKITKPYQEKSCITERRGMNKLSVQYLTFMYLTQNLCVIGTVQNPGNLQFQIVSSKKEFCHLCYLICTLMDSIRLRHSGHGCRTRPHFVGYFGYAEDMCILSLTPCGLSTIAKHMPTVLNSKYELPIFCRQPLPENIYPRVLVNNAAVPIKETAFHLDHKIPCYVSEMRSDNVIAKFYKQYSLFLSRFGKIASLVRNCCSFYDITLCDVKDIYTVLESLRKCIRHIWNFSPKLILIYCGIWPLFVGICWRSSLLNITTVPG